MLGVRISRERQKHAQFGPCGLNMVEVGAKILDRLFRALASGPRREILRLAGQERCAIMQFAAELKLTVV